MRTGRLHRSTVRPHRYGDRWMLMGGEGTPRGRYRYRRVRYRYRQARPLQTGVHGLGKRVELDELLLVRAHVAQAHTTLGKLISAHHNDERSS